jgi:trigger factor
LKIEKQPLADQQIKIIAESDVETLEQFKLRAIRKIARDTKIPGFRPGKAPANVIRRMYSEELIQKEAIELLIDDMYPKVIDEAKIKPYGPGALEEIISQEPPKFSFRIPLEPEVQLGEYRAIRQDYHLDPIEEKDVDESLHRLQTSYATAEPVERPAEKGDLVYLKIFGSVKNPNEGEPTEIYKDISSQVLIGDESFHENNFPFVNFDQLIIGSKISEEKVFSHSYPVDDLNEKIAGKEIEFKIIVQSIKTMKLPALDDAFAKTMGNFENMDALRSTIRTQLEATKKNEYERQYFDELIEKIRSKAIIKYPPQALEHEIEHVLEHIKEDLAGQKLDLETYLKTIKKEKDQFIKDEITPVAIKRLEQSLIFEELANQEKIKLEEKELGQAYSQTIQELQMTTDFHRLQRKMAPAKLSNAIALQAANRLMSDRVFDRLKTIATGQAPEIIPDKESKEKDNSAEKESSVPKANKSGISKTKKTKKISE